MGPDGVPCGGSSPRGRGKPGHPQRSLPARRLIPARAGKTPLPHRSSPARTAHPRAGGENAIDFLRGPCSIGSSPRGRGKPGHQGEERAARGLIPARAGKTLYATRISTPLTAHPRAGGENGDLLDVVCVRTGSSPRGRGKPVDDRLHRGRRGLIPARAGKTGRPRFHVRQLPAHPRAGGENDGDQARTCLYQGSSPRGRGKLEGVEHEVLGQGLIPARAGKTSGGRSRPGPRGAHPRAGGENSPSRIPPCSHTGSSPRGRGKRWETRVRRPSGRLIPARAGKTTCSWSPRRTRPAHPRAGGENRAADLDPSAPRGSSPRGRGKLSSSSALLMFVGLIPARAGKTAHSSSRRASTRAHPRAGGENGNLTRPSRVHRGSSPRGRGKLSGWIGVMVPVGLIPARAGKTRSGDRRPFRTPAHPRAGGENTIDPGPEIQHDGSSPRGRGKLRRHVGDVGSVGLIPARAGKT